MSWIFMLHLIADFTLIVTEGSREDSKDGDGGGTMGKEICL